MFKKITLIIPQEGPVIMRNNLFGTITPTIMMEIWDGYSNWSGNDPQDEDELSFLKRLKDNSIVTKAKEKKKALKLNGVDLESIKGKDYKLDKEDVSHISRTKQKALLEINLADIDTIHALDLEEVEAFNYVATKLSNMVFSEINEDDVERISKVGSYVSEEKYKKAMIESGEDSLREYVEGRELFYKELVKEMIEQLEKLNHLKAITEIVRNQTPEHKEIVKIAIELFKKKYSDIDIHITSLENQLTSFHELEIDLESQKVILDQKISSTRSMIDTYHNRVRVSLNRIKTLKSMKEGVAKEAWDGTLDPYRTHKNIAWVAGLALKFITRERW